MLDPRAAGQGRAGPRYSIAMAMTYTGTGQGRGRDGVGTREKRGAAGQAINSGFVYDC